MKNYHYDPKFFKTFFKGLGITKTELTRILGIKNFSNWPSWLEGKPIQIDHIIRLCNHFDISMECFYPDGNKVEETEKQDQQVGEAVQAYLSEDKSCYNTEDKLRLRLELMSREMATQLSSKESEIALLREQIAQQKMTIEEMRENKMIQRELIEHLKENQNMDFGKSGYYVSEDHHDHQSTKI